MSPRTASKTDAADAADESTGTAAEASGRRGGRRRPSAGITLQEQPAAPASAETAGDQTEEVAAVPTVPSAGRRRPRRSAPPQQPPAPARTKPYETEPGERRIPFSPRTTASLKERLDGATDWLRDVSTSDEDLPEHLRGWGFNSQAEIVNMGLHLILTQLEDHGNKGKPFPVRVRRG